jgi:hypothetical protein
LICLDDINSIKLSGSDVSVLSKSLTFEINKCSNSTLDPSDEPCHPQEEVEEYMKDIQVETWANFLQVMIN